ncbi:hypothetical protein VbVaMValp1_42 [Vibrio phage Vb_VaM_Valp1]
MTPNDKCKKEFRFDQNRRDLMKIGGLIMATPLIALIPITSASASDDFFNGGESISVLGDSISHGAYAIDIYTNGWVKLLGRSLNAEYGTYSYGYTPYLTIGKGDLSSKDIHSINFKGQWTGLNNELATDSVSGLGFKSNNEGDTISITIPTSFINRALIHYRTQENGATFDVFVDGVLVDYVSSSGKINSFNSYELIIPSSNKTVTISVVLKESKPFIFEGISYLSPYKERVCNNYSQSGRRLRYVGEDVIKTVCENSHTVVMALGHNDHGETDPAYQSEVSSKIDLFIQYANQHKVRVVVPDFCWGADSSNWMRVLLKKLASDTGGIYVDLPSMLTKEDGSPADSNHLINTLGMWVDGSHPNIKGNKWIFETVAKEMGLSCSSKEEALTLYDYNLPSEKETITKSGGSLSTLTLLGLTSLFFRKNS